MVNNDSLEAKRPATLLYAAVAIVASVVIWGLVSPAALGAAAGAGGRFVGAKIADKLASRAAAAATAKSQNAVRDATLSAAQDAGYVVPPSAVNPSFLTKRMESIAGKAAIGQQAAAQNQGVTNALARRAVGLADDAPIDEAALETIRKTQGQAYEAVAKLSRNASDALDALRQARFDANAQWKFYNRSGDPAAQKAAETASKAAKFWEQFLESEAQTAGRADLIPALREARTLIAKTHDVERALNESTGDVIASTLGKRLAQGAPLTDELETIARFTRW